MSNTIVPTFRQRIGMAFHALKTQSFPTDPNSFAGSFLGGILPAGGQALPRGTADYLRAYSHMPWLRAVVARVAYDVGATEWRMYVGIDDKGAKVRNHIVQRSLGESRHKMIAEAKALGQVEEIASHPLIDMLASANSVQTGLTARKVTQVHLDLVGDAFWVLERNAMGMPLAYWPVPPSWVQIGEPAATQCPLCRRGRRLLLADASTHDTVSHVHDVSPQSAEGAHERGARVIELALRRVDRPPLLRQ